MTHETILAWGKPEIYTEKEEQQIACYEATTFSQEECQSHRGYPKTYENSNYLK